MIWRLAIAAVIGTAIVIATIMAFDGTDARCDRAGLETWRAANTFCVDRHTGALYAPSFVKGK